MANERPVQIQGELQAQVMQALWQLREGTVERVRKRLPRRHRGAYTTIQTVLNRLVQRGLLSRVRVGNAFVYSPKLSESEYLARSVQEALAGASSAARLDAMASLVGSMNAEELDELKALARRLDRERARPTQTND